MSSVKTEEGANGEKIMKEEIQDPSYQESSQVEGTRIDIRHSPLRNCEPFFFLEIFFTRFITRTKRTQI